LFDVFAGEGGAAEVTGKARPRRLSSARSSFMTRVDLTRRPERPTASAWTSWALGDDGVDGAV